uniref:Protein kinase domain-containing protein n=1 Tax=Pyxicephalus adspersus TaxID=30357 RepID=A0AAV3AUR3_PYXAD|nr:TPA: hypothetical protein GDO54_006879 [Pyxicephalus adspersus]
MKAMDFLPSHLPRRKYLPLEVAVFVFDKKLIDKYQKYEKDQIIDSLKRGVQQLTRLRHPRLLTVQHPLEESRDCLAFCTEPVFASLANVLGSWDNLPSPLPADIKDHKLYDVETKYGLLQVSEGLSFLHSSVKMIHGNLSTENIIINKSGAWKIMGFDFCNPAVNPTEQETKFLCKEWDPNLPPLCLPNPEYLAPEYILSVSCDPASDMYSLGIVAHAVYNKGKAIFEINKQDIYKSFSRQLDQLSHLSPNVFVNIPEEVREHMKLLLNVTPAVRPDADQMTKIPFFDDVGAVTLQYFDSLFQRDNLQKSQFFKGLPKVLPKLPKRVVVQRILPALTSEFVNPDMVPFVLPNVLLIAEECTKEEYAKLILPDLGPVFKQQEPIQILLIFLQKMDLLLTKTPADEIKNSVLPMVYRALEAPSIQIQELCLNIIPTFANLIDYPSMKNSLIPRIKTACLQTSSLAGDKPFDMGQDFLTGTSEKKENGHVPKQPSKISLTLEEKQKLAKEQEQVQKMKSQQPLKPTTMTPAAPVKQTKDLTMTLMENMTSLNSLSGSSAKPAMSGFPPLSNMSGSIGFPAPVDTMSLNRNVQNGLNSNTGFQPSGFGNMGSMAPNQNFFTGTVPMGMNKMAPISTPTSMQNFSTLASPPGVLQQNSFSTPSSDMSSLNNLFGPQKSKVSMNQMSQQKQNPWLNQFVPPQSSQNMSGTMSQTGKMGQTGFGVQSNPFLNPQGFTQQTTTMKNSSSASNDLKDLFG